MWSPGFAFYYMQQRAALQPTNNTRSDVTAVHAAGGAEAEQDGCWLGTEELRQKQRVLNSVRLVAEAAREDGEGLSSLSEREHGGCCRVSRTGPGPGVSQQRRLLLCLQPSHSSLTHLDLPSRETGEEAGACTTGAREKCPCCVLEVREDTCACLVGTSSESFAPPCV